jgi:hypothetical protein
LLPVITAPPRNGSSAARHCGSGRDGGSRSRRDQNIRSQNRARGVSPLERWPQVPSRVRCTYMRGCTRKIDRYPLWRLASRICESVSRCCALIRPVHVRCITRAVKGQSGPCSRPVAGSLSLAAADAALSVTSQRCSHNLGVDCRPLDATG